MNTSHDDGWDTLDTLWRTQAVTPPDLDCLQREARARGWRLRAVTALEWICVAFVGVFFWRSLPLGAEWRTIDGLVVGLYVFTAAFTVWTTYNRRGLSRSGELAPRALVQREIRRAEASLRFWRANAWVTSLLFAALAAAAVGQSAGLIDELGRGSWWTVFAINTPLVIASLVLHRRRGRTLTARRERLQGLADQLDV